MGDKPTIKATCAAGCMWETVHKQDFLDAASFVKLNGTDNTWFLDIGKQYKIISENVAGTGYGFTITFKYNNNGTETSYNFTIPHEDKYANYVVFKLLEASANGTTLTLVYEIAGVRYEETITGTNLSLLEKDYLLIQNAEAVYLFKDDAGLTFEVVLDEFAQAELAKKANTTYVDEKVDTKQDKLTANTIKTGIHYTGQNDTVIESYVSSDGKDWYRIWASGWRECGKTIVANSTNAHGMIVTLPIEFSDSYFYVWYASTSNLNNVSGYVGYKDISIQPANNHQVRVTGWAEYSRQIYACGW